MLFPSYLAIAFSTFALNSGLPLKKPESEELTVLNTYPIHNTKEEDLKKTVTPQLTPHFLHEKFGLYFSERSVQLLNQLLYKPKRATIKELKDELMKTGIDSSIKRIRPNHKKKVKKLIKNLEQSKKKNYLPLKLPVVANT